MAGKLLSIDESRDVLKSLNDMRFYRDYIDTRLAGDFACDIVKHIKSMEDRVLVLEAAILKHKESFVWPSKYDECDKILWKVIK